MLEDIGRDILDAIVPYKWYLLGFACLVVLLLLTKRRIRIGEVALLGIKLKVTPRPIDVDRELADIRRRTICGDNIGLRIALQKCNEVLKVEPTNDEALRLKETLTSALSHIEPFDVKIDSFVHDVGLRILAALWAAFTLIDIARFGPVALAWDIPLYFVFVLGCWFVSTITHEYGHLGEIRRILLEELGIRISKVALFRFIDFGDALCPRGLIRLFFALKAPDTTIHVDSVIEQVIAKANKDAPSKCN